MATASTQSFLPWEEFQKQLANVRGSSASEVASVQPVDATALQQEVTDTESRLNTAQGNLKGYQSKRFKEEFDKERLGELESSIATLDADIANEKSARDTSISKTRRNPFFSSATITGETREIEGQANRGISNLIDERNSLASQYNSALQKINNTIALETEDQEREIGELKFNLGRLDDQLGTYRSELRSQLAFDTEAERWESEFALRLTQMQERAQTGSGGGSTPSTETERFTQRVDAGLEPDPALRATAQRLIDQGIVDPIEAGYSGSTAVRLEAQMNWMRGGESGGITGTMAESEFRRAIRKKWDDESTPQQLKAQWKNLTIEGTSKSPSEIIDDEWEIKTKPGFMGWLGRAFRLGV